MRPIFFFFVLALIAAAIVPRYMGQVGGAAVPAPAAAVEPAPQIAAAAVSGGSRVVIEPDARGHFRVEGAIDGRRLDFLVDTGASVVTLTESDAARLGFHPAPRDYVAQLKTANGTGRVAPARLGMLEIAGLTLRTATVGLLPHEALREHSVLLSLLSRLRRFA